MSRIDNYIDNIYRDFDKSSEEVKELKEEMKAHLYDEIEELKKKGFNEEESINIAIESFGEETNVSGELENIINRQNKFIKILWKVAVILFVAAVLVYGGSLYSEGNVIKQWKGSFQNSMPTIVEDK
jgi:uncharacterized membrane protein YcjF (UPF0283 family)